MPFCFIPKVENPAGASLEFSATNLPSWASIDAVTGEISGTPEPADVGTYRGFHITVKGDGVPVHSPPYTIEVVEVAPGSVTLGWIPPTHNADGTALTDLQGYRIYYGQCPSALKLAATIEDPAVTTHLIRDLTAELWHFVATAFNSEGIESGNSNTASLKIK